MYCGMLEDLGWDDHNALWDAGGPQCVFGETKGKSP